MNAESRPVKAANEDRAGGPITSQSTDSHALSLTEIDALLWRYVAGEIGVLDVPQSLMSWLNAGADEIRTQAEALGAENAALRSRIAHRMRADLAPSERTAHALTLLDAAARDVPHLHHGDDPDRWADEYLSAVWGRFIASLDEVREGAIA